MQSAAPALPKLLPNNILESDTSSRGRKQYAIYDSSAALCSNLVTMDTEKELQKESNDSECVRPADVVSAQVPVCKSICNGVDLRRKEAPCDSSDLPSRLLSNLSVDNLPVSDVTQDQRLVVSTESDANQSSVLTERCSKSLDCADAVSLTQTPFCEDEYKPSTETERCQHTELVVNAAVTDIRTFTVDVADSPEIIFSSARKKKKSVKQGISQYHHWHLFAHKLVFLSR